MRPQSQSEAGHQAKRTDRHLWQNMEKLKELKAEYPALDESLAAILGMGMSGGGGGEDEGDEGKEDKGDKKKKDDEEGKEE